jgi:hypothetical protein
MRRSRKRDGGDFGKAIRPSTISAIAVRLELEDL